MIIRVKKNMEKENEVITIYYKGKRGKISLLSVSIVFLIVIFVILFVAETGPEEGFGSRILGAGFFSIFMIIFFWKYYNSNKSIENILLIKENGNVFNGKVLHVEKDSYENRNNDNTVD